MTVSSDHADNTDLTAPLVVSVVLNWNGWRDTVDCVKSLQGQDYSAQQIVVVDNASTDDSWRQLREALPGVELLQSGANIGFGGGCNVGIRAALSRDASFVWLINSDSVAHAGALSEMVDTAKDQAGAGAVGSVVYNLNDNLRSDDVQLWGGGRVDLWTGRSRHCVVPAEVHFISGASALIRLEALRQIGLFDEHRYFMYWEDTDLSFRLRDAGWSLHVAANARIWHRQSASLGRGNPLLDEYFFRSAIRFLHVQARLPRVSIALLVGAGLGKRLLMGQWRRAGSVLRAWWTA